MSALPGGFNRSTQHLLILLEEEVCDGGDCTDMVHAGLEEAVVQSTEIGAVNSWLRNQPAQVISAAVASLGEALAPYADGVSVHLRGAMWLISSAAA